MSVSYLHLTLAFAWIICGQLVITGGQSSQPSKSDVNLQSSLADPAQDNRIEPTQTAISVQTSAISSSPLIADDVSKTNISPTNTQSENVAQNTNTKNPASLEVSALNQSKVNESKSMVSGDWKAIEASSTAAVSSQPTISLIATQIYESIQSVYLTTPKSSGIEYTTVPVTSSYVAPTESQRYGESMSLPVSTFIYSAPSNISSTYSWSIYSDQSSEIGSHSMSYQTFKPTSVSVVEHATISAPASAAIQTSTTAATTSSSSLKPTQKPEPGEGKTGSSDGLSMNGKVAIGVIVAVLVLGLIVAAGFVLYRRYNFTHRSLKSFLTSGVRYKTYNNATYKDDEGMLIMPDRH